MELPIEYNDVLNKLHDYIIDDGFIERALHFKMVKEDKDGKKIKSDKKVNLPIIEKVEKMEKVEKNICIPNQQDTLFWCYYMIVNGDTAYELLNNKNSLVAKQMKIDLILLIRKNKDILKTYKFDTITNIESNLANDNCINIKTFLALCAIANINIFYTSKKTYFESLMNDTAVVYIVSEIQSHSKYHNKYGHYLASPLDVDEIRNSLYKLDKIDKPIKALSSYKVEDLIKMCEKLAINIINSNGKTKSKKDLYESIIQYF